MSFRKDAKRILVSKYSSGFTVCINASNDHFVVKPRKKKEVNKQNKTKQTAYCTHTQNK